MSNFDDKVTDNLPDIMRYFMSNIFEAKSAYTLWQSIAFSRSINIVGEALAKQYLEVQKFHPTFFMMTERCALITFVILLLHPFDRDERAQSFYMINREKTEKFVADNQEVLQQLRSVRNNVFGHRDIEVTADTIRDYKIPSVDKLDLLFEHLINFYNELSYDIDASRTNFSYGISTLAHDTEKLYMNLKRGEIMRKTEIDIMWHWEKDSNRISKTIKLD